MAKTLYKDASLSHIESAVMLAPEVRVLDIAGARIAINPESGGWAILENAEATKLFSSRHLEGRAAEFCQRAGLANNKTGNPQDLPLYFFEFIVTPACNLGCTYCFANAVPMNASSGADEKLCELFIDRIAEYRAQVKTNVPFVIEFTGGEPLLNFPAIKHTIEYAKSRYGDLLNAEFCLQSNLTALDKDVLSFSREHGLRIGVSCDGFRQLHDAQRPLASGRGSHRLVEKNLKDIFHHLPENTGGIICVVTPDNAHLIPELMLYFYSLGCSQLVFRPMEQIGRGASQQIPARNAYVDGLFDGLLSVITPIHQERGEFIYEQYLSLTFQHLINPARPFMCERSPCGAAKNICAVSAKGDVYSCHQASGNSQFHLGSLSKKSFSQMLASEVALKLQSRSVRNIPECSACSFRSWCASPCPITALSSHGTMAAPTGDCNILRYRYKRAFEGLVKNEFDLDVIAKLVEKNTEVRWLHTDL